MSDEQGTAQATTAPSKKVDVWMIVAIVALVLAVIAVYFAFTYRKQVDDWEAAASETVAALKAAGVELQGTVESGVAGYEQQIADLSSALEQSQTQAGVSASELETAQQDLADTQAELETAQQDLTDSQAQLATTQAELDDANAKLEQLGELVLPNGTYLGPVLGARTEPLPAIIFQDGSAWRVAEVAADVTITVGAQTLTLEEFSTLLLSSDPVQATAANGTYQVTVKKGLATSIVLQG